MLRPEIVDAEKALNHTGYVHVAFSVGNKKLVDELTDRLRSDGFLVISGPRTILRRLEQRTPIRAKISSPFCAILFAGREGAQCRSG